MTRDRGGGYEGGTRSRGASRGSPECRLKQRWCSETETGPLVEENRGERERRVPTRAAREFFLSITKRNSPARSPRSLSPASVAQMSPLCLPPLSVGRPYARLQLLRRPSSAICTDDKQPASRPIRFRGDCGSRCD